MAKRRKSGGSRRLSVHRKPVRWDFRQGAAQRSPSRQVPYSRPAEAAPLPTRRRRQQARAGILLEGARDKSGSAIRNALRRNPTRKQAVSVHGLRTPSRTVGRLPRAILSAPRRDDRQVQESARTKICVQRKRRRRSVIIAQGYGGKNGFKNYRKHNAC